MTGKQWNATKALDQSMVEFLESYGWKRLDDKHWTHQLMSRHQVPFPTLDAVAQTKANPYIGWAATS